MVDRDHRRVEAALRVADEYASTSAFGDERDRMAEALAVLGAAFHTPSTSGRCLMVDLDVLQRRLDAIDPGAVLPDDWSIYVTVGELRALIGELRTARAALSLIVDERRRTTTRWRLVNRTTGQPLLGLYSSPELAHRAIDNMLWVASLGDRTDVPELGIEEYERPAPDGATP